jgi:hypothetical protein
MSRSTGRKLVAAAEKDRASKGHRIQAPPKRMKGQIAQKIDKNRRPDTGRGENDLDDRS